MKMRDDMINIDGGLGEGGGQVLRTSLSLSMVTGRPVRIQQIRAGRAKPGLLRQHLAAVRASADLCGAQVEGNRPGSEELTFLPGPVRDGAFKVVIGTAGSTTLVLQTVLPAMLQAPGPCLISVEGGTHNPMSPPVEFLQRSFLPLMAKMGVETELELIRPGFYPAGGGELRLQVRPVEKLTPLVLKARGPLKKRTARCVLADLGEGIAKRELREVRRLLDFREEDQEVVMLEGARSPGNVLQLILESAEVTEVFTAFGELGVPSAQVAKNVCKQARAYLGADAPVGRHLADQLLLPMALAGKGRFRTLKLSRHTTTNMKVIQAFLPVRFRIEELGDGMVDVKMETNGEEV